MQALSPCHNGQIYRALVDLLSVASSRGNVYSEVDLTSGSCHRDQALGHLADLASMAFTAYRCQPMKLAGRGADGVGIAAFSFLSPPSLMFWTVVGC